MVELAEAKLAGEKVSVDAVAAAVAPMIAHPRGGEMDVIVLACTHFPLLAEEIAAAHPRIAQIDGGPGIARRIAYLTRGQQWPGETGGGIAVFTAPPPASLAAALSGFGLEQVRQL